VVGPQCSSSLPDRLRLVASARPRSHCTDKEITRPQRLGVGYRSSGINEDVGIEADHHRSCISSRLKRCPTSPAHTIRGVAQVRGAPVSVIPIVHSHKRGEPRAIYSGWRACGLVVSLPVFVRCDFMTSLEDCVAVSGLTEEEALAIAEHEHLPDITATAYNKQQRSRDHCNVHCEDPRGL
jgi:hypothetical protein